MKKTPLTLAVVSLFDTSSWPLSVPDIQSHLAHIGMTPNKTSLYRMMDRFLVVGSIQRVHVLNDISYYEKCVTNHYHFSCTKCDSISCVDSEEVEDSITDLCSALQKKWYTLDLDRLPLESICSNCI